MSFSIERVESVSAPVSVYQVGYQIGQAIGYTYTVVVNFGQQISNIISYI